MKELISAFYCTPAYKDQVTHFIGAMQEAVGGLRMYMQKHSMQFFLDWDCQQQGRRMNCCNVYDLFVPKRLRWHILMLMMMVCPWIMGEPRGGGEGGGGERRVTSVIFSK